jgi:hypothetical protein
MRRITGYQQMLLNMKPINKWRDALLLAFAFFVLYPTLFIGVMTGLIWLGS